MSSFKGYRSPDLPLDDDVLQDLEGLTYQDLLEVLRLSVVSVAPKPRRRVINMLHNRQHRNKGRMIPAWYLTSMGFEPMAEIELMLMDSMAHGQITNAVVVHKNDQAEREVAITIYNPEIRQERTFVVKRDDEVRVWKKVDARTSEKVEYDEVVDHGYVNVDYIAGHLDSFFGKVMTVPCKGSGRLTSVDVKGSEPDIYYFTFDNDQRIRLDSRQVVHVHKGKRPVPGVMVDRPWTAPRRPMPRPEETPFNRVRPSFDASRRTSPEKVVGPVPDYWGDSWWYFNNASYAGKVVQLGSGDPAKSGVKGTCTQVTYENRRLIFVIDGFMYKRNRHTVIKVWDKKEN